ncbi:uncharacterized protein LOC134229770 [Saccostrea cucullata]|uniref:uncharacterized protein LOC134229770 n=1 Tax=Saccostrea cuccullata TaxID=36930 RepID=UPI002ECFE82D
MPIYCKEIPDDDFLESINNKSENPLEYLFPDDEKIKIGPVDEVVRSILSFSSKLGKEKTNEIENTDYDKNKTLKENSNNNAENRLEESGNVENSEEEDINKNYDNENVIENLKTHGDDAYGTNLLDVQEYYIGYKNKLDENEDENDNDHHNEDRNADENKEDNVLELPQTKMTTVKDIDSLPPLVPPKYQYHEPDFKVLMSTLFHPFFDQKFRFPSKNMQHSAAKENAVVKDDKQLKMPGRTKRSMQPLFSSHQHYWTWHTPYQTLEVYPKIFDSIASGIIGKRSQIDYPREDIRPLVMN